MQTWFLVQTKANASAIARRNLERQGFAVFQPMERRTIARRGRFVDQIRPYFGGYLFVSYPTSTPPWSLVNSTYGVSRLVSFGGRPAPVPGQIIASLQDSCDENGTISLDRSISPGDEVEIAVGAMKDFVGRVEHLAPNDRAIVLLDFMGKQTKMVVNKAHLRAASGRTKQSGANN